MNYDDYSIAAAHMGAGPQEPDWKGKRAKAAMPPRW